VIGVIICVYQFIYISFSFLFCVGNR
jgi:hypothetical protein